MTKNQIDYWKVVEEQRHNKVMEAETERANKVGQAETQRHNLSTESLGFGTLDETKRHNAATESNELFRNLETKRHNVVQESETAAHNRATETLGFQQLAESSRHNLADESVRQSQVGLGYAQLEETHRANVASEVLRGVDQANKVAETAVRAKEATERARHNEVLESQEWARIYKEAAGKVASDSAQIIDISPSESSGGSASSSTGLGFSLLTPFGEARLGLGTTKSQN